MRLGVVVLGFVSLMVWMGSPARGDALSGEWVSDGLSLRVNCVGDAVTGTIQRGAATFPLTARRTAEGWTGQFKAGENAFDCSATLADGVLTFRTGTKTYTLKPKAPPAVNPLEADPVAPAPAPNPLAVPDTPAPVPTPIADRKTAKHPKGHACVVPPGWRDEVGDDFIELYGPVSPTTRQPTAYIRVAVVHDPTFTQIDDVNYVKAVVASMQANEPGLTLDGDGRTFTNGATRLVMIPFKLKVEGLPDAVPARALLGEIRNKQMAVIFLACEPGKLKECEDLMIAAADDVINGVARPKIAPQSGPKADSGIEGKWADGKTVWDIGPATLTRSRNVAQLQVGGGVVLNAPKEQLCHSIKDGKLYVATSATDAWDRTAACEVFTFELAGDTLTLTDPAGAKLVLRRQKPD